MAAPSNDTAGIRQTVRALKAAGYTLTYVYDGEEDVPVTNETEAVAAITAVDDATLYVATSGRVGTQGWVRFVMGNSPEEVICDHTLTLSHVLDPLCESWWD